ncbi:high-potential iron-sulfur protein [Haloferax sp. ATB1]|uniref:high-potential iron-sulfur protein n=1 Tax=Haloferax sp. ATB1 TaxID=1508454 RepID=UPI0005B21DC7|nr:high-potential iron-sulfur protein [Haloferax sp. ATB1]
MEDDERTPRRDASERATRGRDANSDADHTGDTADAGECARTRRRFIWLTGTAAMAGLAGCSGGGGGATETTTATTTQSSGSTGGVPEAYATATSLDGTQRNPDSLSSQEAVSYQEEPSEGRQCSTCRYYIEDKNGDGAGACAIVAGEISPEGYCVSYVEYEG